MVHGLWFIVFGPGFRVYLLGLNFIKIRINDLELTVQVSGFMV